MKTKFFIAALITGLIFASSAFADTHLVPQQYPTIQAAINAASNGDIVLVSDGTYNETINFLGKAIIVRSVNGPFVTTIDRAYPLVGAAVTFNSAEGVNSIIEGFTIMHGGGVIGGGGGGVYCNNGSSPTIRNNRIIYSEWYGISCYNSSSPIIENNFISRNYPLGIKCIYSSSPVIRKNIIFGSTSDGIELYSNCFPQITENIISANGECAIDCDSAPSTTLIKNNVITGNQFGVFCYNSSTPNIKNNIIIGGRFGIYSSLSSSPTVNYNNVWDNDENYTVCSPGPNDISLDPLFEEYTATITPGESPTIQEAIEAISYRLGSNSPCIGAGEAGVNMGAYLTQSSYRLSGDFVIDVQSGTYPENIILPSYVELAGEEPHATIIDSPGYNNTVVIVNGGKDISISGFTLSGGNIGIKCNNSTYPYIEGNIITANGNGIQTDYNSCPIITNNRITANSNSGIVWMGPSTTYPNILNNKINGNGGDGISIGAYNSPDIINNEICDNGSDGIEMYDIGPRDIKNNIINNNAGHGVNFGWHAEGYVVNNVIAYNGASGIYRLAEAWWCTLKNNIISQNTAFGIKSDNNNWSAYVTSDYNDVWANTQGNYGAYAQVGLNDISQNPLFVDTAARHFSLLENSPCIDEGDPGILDPDETASNIGAFGGPDAKIVNLTLFSDMTQVAPGEALEYTTLLSNNFSDNLQVAYAEEIVLPDGRVRPGVVTPLSLSDYQTIEHQASFNIPNSAPLGDYVYIGKTGNRELGIIDVSSFDFEVTSSMSPQMVEEVMD